MNLSVIIATRGRPDLLKYTLEKTLPNVSREDTKFLVCVDDDDVATLRRMDMPGMFPKDDRIKWSVKPREDSRGEKYDRALREAPADVLLPAVDCAPIVTPAFDQIIINAARLYPDGIGCVYTPMVNASFPGLQAITYPMAHMLGHIYNHDYPYWFIDHELDDIARMIGRYTCVDIQVETQKTRPAKTIRLRDLAFWTHYFDMMTFERRMAARRIIDSEKFKSPDWLKQVLRNSYQPIEARSYWLNGNVRAQAADIEAQRGETGEPDEGYLRAKAKAEKKLLTLYAALKEAA